MAKIINWNDVYDSYPVNRELIWLNNCGTTPAGSHIVHSMSDFLEKYSRKGIFADGYDFKAVKESIQQSIAVLINCKPEEVALIHNTSEGMNLVSWGLKLKPGDEILLLENEYPSNVYPWEHWSDKGVSITFIPMAPSQEEFLENTRKKISSKTKLIALSSVHWCTGMPLPVKEIAEICGEKGIDIALDAAQGAGHVNIDFHSWGIDYLTISAWKWLLGPVGLAVLVVNNKSLPKLNHVFKGTESVENDGLYFPYHNILKPSAERYSYSTGSLPDWVYFRASLDYLGGLGFTNIMNRIHELGGYLADILRECGFQVLTDSFNDPATGIIVVKKKGMDMDMAESELKKRGVIARRRFDGLRLAPHIYNSHEQLDRVGKIIREIVKV